MGHLSGFPQNGMKDSLAFHLAVREVRQRDERYALEAYAFLCAALSHTVKMLDREEGEDHHVAGPELLVGFRDLAMREFGPMALFVMHEWGIRASEDVGNMVFNLIACRYFGKNDNDCLEDFSDGVSLEEALKKPYPKAES